MKVAHEANQAARGSQPYGGTSRGCPECCEHSRFRLHTRLWKSGLNGFFAWKEMPTTCDQGKNNRVLGEGALAPPPYEVRVLRTTAFRPCSTSVLHPRKCLRHSDLRHSDPAAFRSRRSEQTANLPPPLRVVHLCCPPPRLGEEVVHGS